MSKKIKLVQGNTKPDLVCTVRDEETGGPINIAGATPRLHFRAAGATKVRETLIGSVINGPKGVCTFGWGETSLDGEPGPYEGEIEIVFQDGSTQTVYDILKFNLRAKF